MKKKFSALMLTVTLMLGTTAGVHAAEGDTDIVDTAVSAGNFNTLVAAVQEAGLVEALKGEGPYTVFAPTDEAFTALLSELGVTAEELLAREDLSDILLYHVAEGKVLSSDLVDGMEVTMMNGDQAVISLDSPMINDSNIVTPDVEASNGVIHVIDTVLLPPADAEMAPIPQTGTAEGMTTPIVLAFGSLAAGAYIFLAARRKQNA
ncbi:fasciclin domain-containing protein [Paenibacillus lemnae]|uniref:Fasciclin domain-containing protein n=1 Tax=Paenibacillus lemnae TaxID=1330551 RepID=A0A848M348_PAELE|nr:fasciclin domain-containing protein [Paenibacillus lemnae]NMO95438.1 fasciclin domain-containing protein [Paenibacillus lemnae]